MERAQGKVADWLADMVLTGILLTPALAILRALLPIPVPWGAVLIPWIGTVHLLLSWFAARAIAWMLLSLIR